MKKWLLLLALSGASPVLPLKADITYVIQGKPVYYYQINGYQCAACTYTPGTYSYGATPVPGVLATSNGLLMQSSGFNSMQMGGWSWLDLNDLTIAKGGPPPQPPTATFILDKNSSGAGGVNLQWNVTPTPSS